VTRFVLDSSVALSWVVDRGAEPYALTVKNRIVQGDTPVVPEFWQLEIANVLNLTLRRGTLTAGEVEQGLGDYEQFLRRKAELIYTLPSMREVFETARNLSLTSYDALYLELGRREKLPLATLDKRLRSAAVRCGVPTY
jgi:predicted nucleic acid-binding protein